MNVVYSDVLELAQKERKQAVFNWGNFASKHEGYAVLLEEVEELEAELETIKDFQAKMWRYIKNDIEKGDIIPLANAITGHAIKAACEAIQIAAVGMRIQDFLEREGNGHDET